MSGNVCCVCVLVVHSVLLCIHVWTHTHHIACVGTVKVMDLKTYCHEMQLVISGTKAVLLTRVRNHINGVATEVRSFLASLQLCCLAHYLFAKSRKGKERLKATNNNEDNGDRSPGTFLSRWC
jgi:hypothetical protein